MRADGKGCKPERKQSESASDALGSRSKRISKPGKGGRTFANFAPTVVVKELIYKTTGILNSDDVEVLCLSALDKSDTCALATAAKKAETYA